MAYLPTSSGPKSAFINTKEECQWTGFSEKRVGCWLGFS